MTDFPIPPEGEVLACLAATRAELAAHEARWKQLRADSRAYTLALILDYGYSTSKAAMLSGHHRNTIKIWLDVAIGPKGRRAL